jgi:hypothetical protein
MNPVGQRNQAGDAGDDQQDQAAGYRRSEDEDYPPGTGILGFGGWSHLFSLLCTQRSGVQLNNREVVYRRLPARENVRSASRKAGNAISD